MAVSKVILNGNTLIDTTDKTVTSASMLSGITALKNDGTTATGNIASKTSSDLTASNLTVTAPAGHYASAATKTLTDANLVAGNIKKDVVIFGTTGMYEGSGGGGTNYLNYCKAIQFGNLFPSATPNITLPEATTLESLFYTDVYPGPYTSAEVTFSKQVSSLSRAFGNYRNNITGFVSITLNGDLSKVTSYNDAFKGYSSLVEIKGSPLDFSSATNVSWGPHNTATTYAITYVRYVANSLKVNQSIAGAPSLSNDSIVSIANGLNDSVTGKTITLHATVSGKLSTIYGTVSNGVFTETGVSTDTTLLSFITNTKGWTVA